MNVKRGYLYLSFGVVVKKFGTHLSFIFFVWLVFSAGCLFFDSSSVPSSDNNGTVTCLTGVCVCEKDGDCVLGERCLKGICLEDCLSVGMCEMVCLTDADCSGDRCLEGKCISACSQTCENEGCLLCEGASCSTNEACLQGVCEAGICSVVLPDHCENKQLDDTESDIDCGGECGPCGVGMFCSLDADCETRICGEQGFCLPPLCGNGGMDGNESDIDCGGECDPCGYEKGCMVAEDCFSGSCSEQRCYLPGSCSEIYEASTASGTQPENGVYTLGFGGRSADVFCDMRTGGEGFTLLLSAKKNSKIWSVRGQGWEGEVQEVGQPNLRKNVSQDRKTLAYSQLKTNTIRLCHQGVQERCFDFQHNKNIPLRDFFGGTESYVAFSTKVIGVEDTDSTQVNTFLSAFDVEVVPQSTIVSTCSWLGINESKSSARIGFMADNNSACSDAGNDGEPLGAIGFGLGLPVVDNKARAGAQRYVHKAGSTTAPGNDDKTYTIGPWVVFGK